MAKALSRKDFSSPKRLPELLRSGGGRKEAVEAFGHNPEWFCRAWATAEGLKERRKACLDALREIFLCPAFDRSAIVEIVRHLVQPAQYSDWPGSLVSGGDARLASVVVLASCQIDEAELASAAARALMGLPTQAWTPILRHAVGGSPSCMTVVVDFILAMMLDGKVPIPRSDADGVVLVERIGRLIPLEVKSDAELVATTFDDPKIVMGLEPVAWTLETQQLAYEVGEVVEQTIQACLVPDEVRDLCLDFASRETEISEQIGNLWGELCAAANGGDRSIRRWVTSDGSTQVAFELLGHDVALTGVAPATLFIEQCHSFPRMRVELSYVMFSRVFTEKTEIGEGGLFSVLEDHEEGSSQRGLRLLQNLMVVRELHRIAFAEGYCGEQNGNHSHNGTGNGNGAPKARLTHFRRIGHLHRQDGRPYEPSEEALSRVPTNVVVPPGCTYVASPPIHSRAMHPNLKPLVLEVTTEGLC